MKKRPINVPVNTFENIPISETFRDLIFLQKKKENIQNKIFFFQILKFFRFFRKQNK